MSQVIKLKRSAVQGNIPTTAQIDLGEIAINTYDGKVFIKKDDGTQSVVEIGAGGSSIPGLSSSGAGSSDMLTYTGERLILDTGSIEDLYFGKPPNNDVYGAFIGRGSWNRIKFGFKNSTVGYGTAITATDSLDNIIGLDILSNTKIGTGSLEVLTTGEVIAPNLTSAIINATGNTSLVTKEYVDAQSGGSSPTGLESITENGNTGWRLIGRNPSNYGDIGPGAIDLSYSNSTSTEAGATGTQSFASGYYTISSGNTSHAEGYYTTASGDYSHAEGYNTYATGVYSHAEGFDTNASGQVTHAEGQGTIAQNNNMHAAGSWNVGTATDTIHETGIGTNSGNRLNAFEIYTDGTLTAPEATISLINSRGNSALTTKEYVDAQTSGGSTGLESITENGNIGWRLVGRDPAYFGDIGPGAIDFSNKADQVSTTHGATGGGAFAIGGYDPINAEWYGTTAGGASSFAGGLTTQATGNYSMAMGYSSVASGTSSFAIGDATTASGNYATAEGANTTASGYYSHAEGDGTTASNNAAHAEGYNSVASAARAHAEGHYTLASGNSSHAEGSNTISGAYNSHAEGRYTSASGESSHAEGYGYNSGGTHGITASGLGAHAEGSIIELYSGYDTSAYATINAIGNGSHVEGGARAYYSSTQGAYSSVEHKAVGLASHAEGLNTIAQNEAMHAAGKLNIGTATDTIHETGIGTYDEPTNTITRKNAFEIYTDGRIHAPEQTIALHDDPKSLTTKEYVDANAGGGPDILEVLTVGSTEYPTLTDAMDYTKNYYGASFKILFDTAGTYSYTLDVSSRIAYPNNYIFESTTTNKTDVVIDFQGTTSSTWAGFQGSVEFNHLKLTGSGTQGAGFVRFFGGINVIRDCEVSQFIFIPYAQAHLIFTGGVDTSTGGENAIWGYEQCFIEMLDNTNLWRTEIVVKNGSTVYSKGATLGDQSGSYTGTALDLIEDSRLLIQHTDGLTIQNIDAGIKVEEGSKVFDPLKKITQTNVITEYNIPVATMQPNDSCIYNGDTINYGNAPKEANFDATANQTAFVVTGAVFTDAYVYTNGVKDRDTTFSISDNGTDTTITFTTGKNLNDWVSVEYV